jgi:hypothetical protein
MDHLPKWAAPIQSSTVRKNRGYIITAVALLMTMALVWSSSSKIQPMAQRISQASTRPDAIPNIVHYVQMQKNEHAELTFKFEAFLSMYSALRMLKPDAIYIHTDFNESMVARAKESGSKWTRIMLNTYPDIVKVNYVTVPTYTNGHKIVAVEHRSDMIRFEQTHDKGGMYLDTDVVCLRDSKPLREAGFRNVVGRELRDGINNGLFMTQKGSTLAKLMIKDQAWTTHSVELLTSIAQRLAWIPNEVLIMEMKAFAPTSWESPSAQALFNVHEEKIPQFPQKNEPDNLDSWARWQDRGKAAEWEIDFSETYFLHAFHNHFADIPGFKGVSVKYVMDRTSNYALATWPIVNMCVKEGVCDAKDETFV